MLLLRAYHFFSWTVPAVCIDVARKMPSPSLKPSFPNGQWIEYRISMIQYDQVTKDPILQASEKHAHTLNITDVSDDQKKQKIRFEIASNADWIPLTSASKKSAQTKTFTEVFAVTFAAPQPPQTKL